MQYIFIWHDKYFWKMLFPGMLDHIMVEHYGAKTPLSRMAVVSVLDSKTLSVTPYDPNVM